MQEFPLIFSNLSVRKQYPNHNYELHSAWVFHVSVSGFRVGEGFFLLWIFIWVYETTEIIFPRQQLKFQPIRNHDQITCNTAVWTAFPQMIKYGRAISQQKINFPAQCNVCFDTFWKSIEVFSINNNRSIVFLRRLWCQSMRKQFRQKYSLFMQNKCLYMISSFQGKNNEHRWKLNNSSKTF